MLCCSNGNWIASFARNLGSISSNMAELWALKDGLSLARQLNLDNINTELDANVTVFFLLSSLSTVNLMLKPFLTVCRNLNRSFPNCTVTHI